jgi:hypothetical protein
MAHENESAAGEATLEQRAEAWIADYSQARHLVRTRDWAVEIDPGAEEALRLAALTHDIERRVPGGPIQDRAGAAWDDPEYLLAHSERSASIVGAWIREQRGTETLAREVEELIRAHEVGGWREADVLQAADSISFLETLADLSAAWVHDGLCSAEKARQKHIWMYERIRIPLARELARPYYEAALAAVEAVPASGGARVDGGAR